MKRLVVEPRPLGRPCGFVAFRSAARSSDVRVGLRQRRPAADRCNRRIRRSSALLREARARAHLAGETSPAALLGFCTLRSLAPVCGCPGVSAHPDPPAVGRPHPSRSVFTGRSAVVSYTISTLLDGAVADDATRLLGFVPASQPCPAPTHIGTGRCCLGLLLLQALRNAQI